ncbi:MAG: hypothetical protein JWP41_2290 [Ramlibacter sp.]|nr:hypothetical protein [Ramlibacter sp.]
MRLRFAAVIPDGRRSTPTLDVMFNRAWVIFKLLLSVALVAIPIALFVAAPRALLEPAFVGLSAMLVFFAAILWVDFTRPNRALGLAAIVISIGIALLGARTALGYVQFPQPCSGRGRLFCEIENLLFLIGGEFLAAAPFGVLAVCTFALGVRVVGRAGRAGRLTTTTEYSLWR